MNSHDNTAVYTACQWYKLPERYLPRNFCRNLNKNSLSTTEGTSCMVYLMSEDMKRDGTRIGVIKTEQLTNETLALGESVSEIVAWALHLHACGTVLLGSFLV